MQAFYCDHFVLPLPAGHRFPMEKYRRLRERVSTLDGCTLRVPAAATTEELIRAHAPEWVARVSGGTLSPEEIRRIGFPWSPGLVERSRRSTGGTLAAARAALSDGLSANLAGGTHHAFRDRGEGFCVFNDVAVAARTVQSEGLVDRIAVIDLDVHQGNGTAAIFADDDTVFTLSVHGGNNFPFRKERSDLDLELPDGCTDGPFLHAVEIGVRRALATSPELAFFVAGADPFMDDRLGRLSVTKAGLAERDRIVFEACEVAGVPVAIVMSGGYARDVEDTVDIHFQTVAAAVGRIARRAA